MSEKFNPQIFDPAQGYYAHQFGAAPGPDQTWREAEPVPLGKNVSSMRRRRDARKFSWIKEGGKPSQQEQAVDEIYARFFETYGGMFTSKQSYRLMRSLMEGDPYAYGFLSQGVKLRAALSPDDYPLLFGDTIDRILLAKYRALESDWRNYILVKNVMDFRAVKRFKAGRGGGILPVIGPGGAYDPDKPSESSYSYAVEKRGSIRNIFWESLINDDLGALSETPDDFSYRARQTEAYTATGFFMATGGVNTDLYATDHSFTTDDGAESEYSNSFEYAATAQALAYVISQMGNFPDDTGGGLPFSNDPIHVVIATRAMQFKMEQIINSPAVMAVGSSDERNIVTGHLLPDQLRSRMQVHYNPMIRLYDTTNYQTRWFMFADLADGHAVEVGFLQGYQDPQLFMRASAQLGLSGGLASPMMGSFDTDSVDYKIRMVIGGNSTEDVGGWRFTATSYDNGAAVPNT